MSCNESTNKYPYVYECCTNSIDGITTEFLKELWDRRGNIEGHHLVCCACGKEYHIFTLGLKWTERVYTHQEIIEYKKLRDNYLVRESEEIPEKVEGDIFKLTDIPKFICRVCKKGMFETEPLNVRESFIEDLNNTIGIIMKLHGHSVSKEAYIEEFNKTSMALNSCRRCTELGKLRMNIGKYN